MTTHVFGSSNKAHHPLSVELELRAKRTLGGFFSTCVNLAELEAFLSTAAPEKLAQDRPKHPVLGEPTLADVVKGGYTPWDATGARERKMRHSIIFRVEGTADLLYFWPDRFDDDIKPIDEHILDLAGGWDELTTLGRDVQEEFDELGKQWSLEEAQTAGGSTWFLRTYVDLTLAEEQSAADGRLDLQGLFEKRIDQILPIVRAVGDQIDAYWDFGLPERISELAEAKRKELENRAAVVASLKFKAGWAIAEPGVVLSASSPRIEGRPTSRPIAATDGEVEDVSFEVRAKLDPATFTDVQRVIRTWADAVERYPKAFALKEDRVSDLLCATLNATVPGAGREVYTRAGRSDIYVQADVIRQGYGPATIFVCEAKWARSSDVISKALDPQLFSYMTVHDTSAVLLLLQPQVDFSGGKQTSLQALRKVDGLVEESDSAVEGWPLLRYGREGKTISICVAFVHLPGG